jgi:RNA polymerase sigma-70 factor (ECF subfamily)
MTYNQIAVLRGLSVKTVEWRMSKALDHCTQRLDERAER